MILLKNTLFVYKKIKIAQHSLEELHLRRNNNPDYSVNIVDFTVTPFLQNGKKEGTSIRSIDNQPSEGYRIVDISEYMGQFVVKTPSGDHILLNYTSFLDSILSGEIKNGELIGKYCLGIKNGVFELLLEGTETYQNSIRFTDENEPVSATQIDSNTLKPGVITFDNYGRSLVYLGKYDYISTGIRRVDSIYTYTKNGRPSFFFYNIDSQYVTTSPLFTDHAKTIVPNFEIMSSEEAFMMAFYNTKEVVPIIGEPEMYIENTKFSAAHMLHTSGRYSYAQIKSVTPIRGGVYGFSIETSKASTPMEGELMNMLVIRAAGLKRVI